ncbi:sulfur carrier protein ThiS [Heliophilum fasciatum]|uniref:Sulfur carrier protein n=1 Tax=Heliophilum fasciatum TaxID=35700 RepID=A0A4R2RPW7_9FIRM|nr:sulfur carrier protein ThiS [Heliophilum fasciatum]MCW2277525.1 sulfur carrier protein [Heliophilum fasciatum]TCP65184.1 sulfur carrier protein [Heliophilum fasciatum]
MGITVNGQPAELTGTQTLSAYLTKKMDDLSGIIVEYNGQIIKQDQWATITLQEKDNLEVLRFVGGG